jgi:hypothetical protein
MNLSVSSLRKITIPEISLLLVFVVYILFPISTPQVLVPLVDSPIGYVSIFIITILLFVYTSPLLGILYIFVAYELIRRSSSRAPTRTEQPEHTKYTTQYMPTHVPKSIPTQSEKDLEMLSMNQLPLPTLEEEIVEMRAPIGKSELSQYTESSFKPVADNLIGASMYN